jgi:hypothetical protein
MQLPDKYKNKTFADISKEIQSKYKDRYDPISNRGKMAELNGLKQAQEQEKLKQEFKQKFAETINSLASGEQQTSEANAPMGSMPADNEGLNVPQPNMQEQGHPASQSYSQDFGDGGEFEPFLPSRAMTGAKKKEPFSFGDLGGFGIEGSNDFSTPETSKISDWWNSNDIGGKLSKGGQGLEKLAPMAINIGQLLSSRKPKDVRSQVGDTQLDNAKFTAPSRTHYSKVDFAPIEKGVREQGRAFSATNRNVSGGNAGQFLANEQGNQGNMMDAIANARMQEQIQNNQVAGMNAQDKARYEQILNQQAMSRQNTEQANIGLGFQIEDINARNLGAYQSNKSNILSQLGENLSARNKEKMLSQGVLEALGYGVTGKYANNPEELNSIFANIFKARGNGQN